MKPALSLILTFCMLTACSARAASADSLVADAAALDALVRATIAASQNTPDSGVAVAVVKDGQVLFSKGYGLRDRARGLPFDENTLFAIGSTSKAFTSFALALVEQYGLIDLEKPVSERLPEFSLKDASFSSRINAIDLLSHRTGMPGYTLIPWKKVMEADEFYSRIPLLDLGPNPESRFRNSFVYNNEMYLVASKLLERVTGGRSWQSLMRGIFNGLGMSASGFTTTPLSQYGNAALPYYGATPMPIINVQAYEAAGGIRSTLVDMTRWLKFLLAKGKSESGEQLVPEATFERMYEVNNVIGGNPNFWYGLGWYVKERSPGRFIMHGGALDGYYAQISFIPELGIGVVVLANEHRSVLNDNISGVVYRYLSNAYFPAIDPPLDQAFSIPFHVPNVTPEQQAAYLSQLMTETVTTSYYLANPPTCIGTYSHPGLGELQLCVGSNGYLVKYGPNYWQLVYKSHDPVARTATFEISMVQANWYLKIPLVFGPGAAGNYTELETTWGTVFDPFTGVLISVPSKFKLR